MVKHKFNDMSSYNMPKSSEMDRTEGKVKPEGENTSESGPTNSANLINKISKTKKKKVKANAKIQKFKNLF